MLDRRTNQHEPRLEAGLDLGGPIPQRWIAQQYGERRPEDLHPIPVAPAEDVRVLELAVLRICSIGAELDRQRPAAEIAAQRDGIAIHHHQRRPYGLSAALAKHPVTDLGRG